MGKKPAGGTTLCVEATQWQPALQRARSLQGDEGPLSNFSIELLDDGYRAIDPGSRLRYVVRRAPDDAALSNGGAALSSTPPPSGGDGDKTAAADNNKASKPPSSASVPPPAKPAAVKDGDGKAKANGGAAHVSVIPAVAKDAAAPAKKTAPPRPESVKPAPVELVEAKALIAIPMDRPPRPPPGPGLPKFEVQSTREEAPTARSPLHYREVVLVVAEGTSEAAAERLVRDRFADVKGSLAEVGSGKLVNLAVFDHAYVGKPKRRPLVTLSWKDWRGDEPEVRIPSREPNETPTPLAPAADKPVVVAAPQPAPVPASPRPVAPVAAPHAVSAPAPAPASVSEPPRPRAHVEAVPEPEPVVAAAPVEVEAEAAPEPPAPEPPAPEPIAVATPTPEVAQEVEVEVEVEVAAEAAPEAAVPSEPPSAPPLVGPRTLIDEPRIEVLDASPASFPTPSIAPPTPSYVPPVPRQPLQTQPPPPPVPPGSKKRIAGDDLLAELFEALSELGFMHDALSGAEYVLSVALEKIPSEVGLVSFFDINKREFVVAKQMGGARSVLGFRQPEKAPIAIQTMRKKQALVLEDPEEVGRALDERWRAIGVEPTSLVCAPIALGGRYLGLIEIANPAHGGSYDGGDGHALTYVGQQFGEFLAERGVVIDAEQILKSAETSAEIQTGKRH